MDSTPTTKPLLEESAPRSVRTSGTALPRVVLAHDWFEGYRGGEAVLDAIVRLCEGRFEIAGMFVMFDAGKPITPAIDALPRTVSYLNRLPGARGLRRWLLPMYPSAVADLSRKLERLHAKQPIDMLVSTSSAAIKGLEPPAGVPHICYCHSPARYLWSQVARYGSGRGGTLRSWGLRFFGDSLRAWDRSSAQRVTSFVANSSYVAREIARVYKREAVVVHPPVRTTFFTPPPQGQARAGWLCVGALEPYKQIDLAIKAAAQQGAPLTVVGSGSQEGHLRRAAGPAVKFTGHVSDLELRALYQGAKLLLFPQVEDFGIVAVEAQACGTPVLAFGAGGALDSVIERETGMFFHMLRDIPKAVEYLSQTYLSPSCRANAERFSEDRFEREMLAVIDRVLS